MKPIHLAFLFSFIGLAAPLRAITVSEPPDQSGSQPGTNYTLDTASNTFSGTITTPGDAQDNFTVTCPAGKIITGISKTVTGGGFTGFVAFNNNQSFSGTGTASFTTGIPASAGAYQLSVVADFSTGASWSITVTLGDAPDYTVSTSGGFMTVTDTKGNGDALAVTQPSAGNIRFEASGRTFSVNGGAHISGNSGNLSLGGITAITVDAAGGADTITVGAFASMPHLTINGGTGDDNVNFTGDISFTATSILDVDLQDDTSPRGVDNVTVGSNVNLTGASSIEVRCTRAITVNTGGSLQCSGALRVEANQQTPATTGNFTGVLLDGAGTVLESTGAGTVTVKGRGGDDAGGFQLGVLINGGAKIMGGGAVNVTGDGGASTGIVNRGVTVYGSGSEIVSSSGAVNVTGTAGASGGFYGIGVSLLFGGKIRALGGNASVSGVGAGGPGSGFNMGIEMGGANSAILANAGNVTLTATAGPGAPSGGGGSWGVYMTDSAEVTIPYTGVGSALTVSVVASSVSLDATASISSSPSHAGVVQFSSALPMDIGGADTPSSLGLTDAELDRITATTLRFAGSSAVSITSGISPANVTHVSHASTGKLTATATGVDVVLATGALTLAGPLAMPITGGAFDTAYPALVVQGDVTLGGALDLTGTTYAGSLGEVFYIILNNTTNPVAGTFTGLPEGGLVAWPGDPALRARISYTGGDGNDVTLTLAGNLLVTNTQDSGAGSLRVALTQAASNAGADIISFAPDYAAITQIGSGASSFATDDSVLENFTLAAGVDRALVVFASHASEADITGVTFNGQALTQVVERNDGAAVDSIWVRAMGTSTTATTANIVVTRAGSISDKQTIFALGYANVDQATPMDGAQSAVAASAQSTLSVASGSGNLVLDLFDAFKAASVPSATPGGGQTLLQSVSGALVFGNARYSVSSRPGAASVPMSWTGDGTDFIHIAANLRGSARHSVVLGGEIVVSDATGPVTIEGYSAPHYVTLDAGAGTNRHFSVSAGSTLNLRNLALKGGNGTGAAGSGSGGAIRCAGTLSLTDCLVDGNVVPFGGVGGALHLTGAASSTTLSRCTFQGNSTSGGSSGGGAIFADSSAIMTADDCAFISNTSANTAGAVHAIGSAGVTLNRCTLEGNGGPTCADAGAVRATGASATLVQCTLAGNTVTNNGGAIYSTGTSATILRHCTIAGNSAANGSGVRLDGGTLSVVNTIVAANTATSNGPDFHQTGGALSRSGKNIIGINTTITSTFPAGTPNGNGDHVGTSASPVNALLSPLGNFLGASRTMATRPGSPARDAASVLSPAITSDQRGAPIVGAPDIGAYEAGTLSSFAIWSWETLPASVPVNQHDPDDDPDGDGRKLLLEYAAQGSGSVPEAGAIPVFTRNPAGTLATLVIPYRYSVGDLAYAIERSTDLVSWTSIVSVHSPSNTYAPGAGITLAGTDATTLTFTDSFVTGQTRTFYRLSVSQL